MSEDWGQVAADVGEGIASVGTAAQISVTGLTGPAHDRIAGTDALYPVTVVFAKNKRNDEAGSDGESRRVLVSVPGAGIVPEPGHKLMVGSDTYNIESVEEVAPAGVPVMWKLEVSR